jgi:outer membrane lipoprotein-sorting protein
MMKEGYRRATVLMLVMCFMSIVLLAVAGCSDRGQNERVSEIRQNASRTLDAIYSLHTQAEVRKVFKSGEREYTIIVKSELWVKGNDLLKETTETSGREALGMPASGSTSFLNGNTYAGMGEDYISTLTVSRRG